MSTGDPARRGGRRRAQPEHVPFAAGLRPTGGHEAGNGPGAATRAACEAKNRPSMTA